MRSVSLWKYSLAAVALLWGLGLGGYMLPQAQAACTADCGDTITGSVSLNCDLFCSTNPALTVDGGSLDLNGHRVTCDNTSLDGIKLIGSGATLTNTVGTGIVTDCHDGVILADGGSHKVSKVISQNNDEDGFDVDSELNTLDNNTSFNNGFDGFFITKRKNTLQNNDNVSYNDVGFEIFSGKNKVQANTANNNYIGFVIEGTKNFLTGNTANDNIEGFLIVGDDAKLVSNTASYNYCDYGGGDGFLVAGNLDRLINNTANYNCGDGFRLDSTVVWVSSSANNAQLTGNTATNNWDNGFELNEGSHKLVGNTANDNYTDGFQVNTDLNTLKVNKANHNNNDGIHVTGSQNRIKQNVAPTPGGGSNVDVDLFDDNADCDSNLWTSNTFGSANQTCIH